MKKLRIGMVCGLLLFAVTTASPTLAEAQQRVTVGGGRAEYDLSGTGWSGTVEAHFEHSLTPRAAIEAGTGAFWYTTQGGTDVVMLLPEIGVRFERTGRIRPYFTAGVGHTITLKSDRPTDPTLFAATGISLDMHADWLLRPEVRIRFIDPFVGAIGGYTLLLSKRVG